MREGGRAMSGWLGVVSADHVRLGIELGIAQIGHGKRSGLARMHAGDTLVYYSSVEHLGDTAPLRQFTAIGEVADDEIWQAEDGDFRPFRRRIRYEPASPVELAAVKHALQLTAGPNWGYQLRRGLIPLADADIAILRAAMRHGA
jgi:hypothetical protein